jgi:uncharacterized protein GlcG (DUF336 family)
MSEVSSGFVGLTDAIVTAVVQAAVDAARVGGPPIAITVVDDGGHVVASRRMDGVAYMANDVARRKATTANAFRMPTRGLAAIAAVDAVVGADLAKNAEVCQVAGGMPILIGTRCLGGLGVAGGRAEDDQRVAEAALAAATMAFARR